MTEDLMVPLLMRWAHILAAITVVGGSIFIRLVLIPVAGKSLDEEAFDRLRRGLMGRWKFFVHTCIVLFLVSGTYNFTRNISLYELPWTYVLLFGLKFVLAMTVFVLAVMLSSSANFAAKIRAGAKRWLLVLIALALTIVMISGTLKTMPKKAKPEFPTGHEIPLENTKAEDGLGR